MAATYAILIGVETYQQQGIDSVPSAQADVTAVKEVLIQNLGVAPENITHLAQLRGYQSCVRE